MRSRTGIATLGAALLLVTASGSMAGEVNCKQVNKYLQTGRSVSEVAETMVISESDVKKCQDQAGDTKGGGTKGDDKGDAGKKDAK
jgi:hypothetical protein